MTARIFHGDCRTVLASLPVDSIDAVVTDPPYHLTSMSRGGSPRKNDAATPFGRTRLGERGFMGKTWDGGNVAQDPATWIAVARVMKPGAHLVAFSGTRTYHRMVCAIEDAGFEIRDQIGWAYGQRFPKSRDIGDGWGTALKPAWEPIVVARKRLSEKTVEANVARWGTGAINIRACRIGFANDKDRWNPEHHRRGTDPNPMDWGSEKAKGQLSDPSTGRWPANLIHDGSQGVLELFPQTKAEKARTLNLSGAASVAKGAEKARTWDLPADPGGSAARFFYCAKASASDLAGSKHPTVKPRALMRYLCRLVTPTGGVVLDPFAGSGTTLYAAQDEGFGATGIELDPEYFAFIEGRLNRFSEVAE